MDEADELLLGNPGKFLEMKGNNFCICLTATPDNNDDAGIERAVL
jgi:hypothetical protein